MANKEIESKQKRTRKIVDDIREGNIKIPDFQRDFVWSEEQVVKLLDSIYNDFPIGSILLWETKERLNSLRNIGGIKLPEPKDNYPVKYVLDGQQRLSSLFAVLHHDAEEVEKEIGVAGIDDYDIFDVYFDLDTKEFKHRSNVPEIESSLFGQEGSERFLKLNSLRRAEKYREKMREVPKKYVETVDGLINKFENYEIPIVTVKGRNESEVGAIFERINNTGRDLKTMDLMIAWTWSRDFNLREEIKDIKDSLEDRGFGDIKEKIILQCISAVYSKKINTDNIIGSLRKSDSTEEKISHVKNSLERTIDFLRTQFNVYNIKSLPSSFQIIPLVYLFSRTDSLSRREQNTAQRWFWRTSFTTRYRDSTNYRVHADISFFDSLVSGDKVSPEDYNTDVNSEGFFSRCKFHRAASVTKAYVLMLSQENPKDLLSGQRVSIEETFTDEDFGTENHHVFPRGFLKSKGYDERERNSLANVCLLSTSSNRTIADSPPSEYMFFDDAPLFDNKGKKPEVTKDILSSNLLPTDTSIYKDNNFENFVLERRRILYDRFTDLI